MLVNHSGDTDDEDNGNSSSILDQIDAHLKDFNFSGGATGNFRTYIKGTFGNEYDVKYKSDKAGGGRRWIVTENGKEIGKTIHWEKKKSPKKQKIDPKMISTSV